MPNPTLPPPPTVAGLRDRLKAGEPVSPEELVRAEAAERFDRLRGDAATEAAAERAEAERQGRIAALRAALPARFDPAPIARAEAKLARAVDDYLDACRAHDDALEAAAEELRGAGPLPAGLAVDAPRFGQITDGGAEYRGARPQVTIAGVVTAAHAARYPRRGINLNSPQD